MSRLDWQVERHRWPNADYSSFVSAGALRWHIQHVAADHETARRPKILLVHGARRIDPLMARQSVAAGRRG